MSPVVGHSSLERHRAVSFRREIVSCTAPAFATVYEERVELQSCHRDLHLLLPPPEQNVSGGASIVSALDKPL
jgi:hypothetical protein